MAGEHVDMSKLSKLKLRITLDDPIYQRMPKLKVRGKDLAAIPKEVYWLNDLQVLDLSPERESCLYYKITQISPFIGQLANLRVLMLDTNELVDLPDELCILMNLERLSLSNNHFAELPENFGQLKNLQSLHMSNNEFVQFPIQVCELENLIFLDISDNDIAVVPAQIKKLHNLETLILFHNHLTSVSEEICSLTTLRTLWIGDNNITSLPRDIVKLRGLDWGMVPHTMSPALDGNPITVPPLETCKSGIAAIAQFFLTYKGDTNGKNKSKPNK